MKIQQLLSMPDISVAISNQENKFIQQHPMSVKINNLDEHDQWTAQALVRKGLYDVSKDDVTLIRNIK